MNKRKHSWIGYLGYLQLLIIITFLVIVFSPEPIAFRVNPVVGLKQIHDLVLEARRQGTSVSEGDIEKKIEELKHTRPYGDFKIQVIGSGSRWMVICVMPRKPQSKFEAQLFKTHEWPAYVLSSDDDGFVEIDPSGNIVHGDFTW